MIQHMSRPKLYPFIVKTSAAILKQIMLKIAVKLDSNQSCH